MTVCSFSKRSRVKSTQQLRHLSATPHIITLNHIGQRQRTCKIRREEIRQQHVAAILLSYDQEHIVAVFNSMHQIAIHKV